ncbi:hypothetical protein MMC07_001025 [Pseudocyphellaria aurata]|nr:hypothetical protein [Pseudocyphellaria aurata]
MTPSSDAVPMAHSPSGYLKLLTATTHVKPKPRIATSSQNRLVGNAFDMTIGNGIKTNAFDMPIGNGTKTATIEEEPGSISNVSTAGSGGCDDKRRFLELAPVTALVD